MSPLTDKALTHHRAGRLAEAEALYVAALDADPGDAETLRLLSILKSQQGRADEALGLAERAQRADPASAKANATLASALQAVGRLEEALAGYERALAIDPRMHDTLFNRGVALEALGRPADALASYDAALAVRPDLAEALANRGNALQALGRPEEALASYDRALAVRPALLEAINNRGAALQALGRYDDAVATYGKLLALRPDLPNVLVNLGTAYQAMERHAEAVASYDRALALAPGNIEALKSRCHALHLLGRRAEAVASYERALALAPEDAGARWSLVMVQLPVVCDDDREVERSRAAFDSGLDALDAWLIPARLPAAADAVGEQQPFMLAYHERDNRDLLKRYGDLCARVMADWRQRASLRKPAAGPTGAAVRVGIASRFFQDHSIWNAIVKGWFERLDPARISLHAFHLGPAQDAQTALARSRAARFVQGRRGVREWAEAILAERLDVLIYPEVGIDPTTVKLASMRLAPLQAATWGHPQTTGLPTIDHYLSADDFEPHGAERHYTERLVRLPNLGCHYAPPAVEAREPDLDALGIGSGAPILLCPGMPFKYAPEHDGVFPGIARRLGRCRFVFFAYRAGPLYERLARRLRAAFSVAGMEIDDYVAIVPWQARASWYGLLRRADVFLDTIGFSGFNTAMQAIECALPVVTTEGPFLRGRLASGILARMGLRELIARDDEDYAERAARLCRDAGERAHVRGRIAQARGALFTDDAPIRALERFLLDAAGAR